MENQRNGLLGLTDNIPMSQLNPVYQTEDDDDGYIDPQKLEPYRSAQDSRLHSQHSSADPYTTMDLIRDLPSKNPERLTNGLQQVTTDSNSHSGTLSQSGTIHRQQGGDPKYLTMQLASLHSSDMDADTFYNIITSNADMTADEMRMTLRNAHQSLTLKRTVKKRLTFMEHNRRRQSRISIWTKWRYSWAMMIQNFKHDVNDLISNFDLWHSHIKTVQGNFGSGVTYYFLFLRWIFFLNIFMCFLLVSFISVPQLIYSSSENATSSYLVESNLTAFNAEDIFTGSGYFSDTIMYYGFYINETIEVSEGNRYSMPLAYLLTFGVCALVSILVMAFSTVKSYEKNYIETSVGLKNVFAAKIFSSWDYSIETHNAASLKSRSIYNELKELLYTKQKDVQSSLSATLLKVLVRTFLNLTIFGIIGGCGYVIYLLLHEKILKNDIPVLNEMSLPLVIGAFGYFLPKIFLLFSEMEWYSSKQLQLYINLVRVTLLKLVILGVLMFSWLSQTHVIGNFSSQGRNETNITDQSLSKTCWENKLGQEFYRLVIIHTLIILMSTIVEECLRRLLYNYCFQWLGPPEFSIAYNTLDLVYTQTLVCVGMFFCPLLPLIAAIKLVIIFYIKRFSVMNCQPSLKPWKAFLAQTIFLSLILVSGILSFLAVGYAIITSKPSSSCGPFKELSTTYEIVLDLINVDNEFSKAFTRYILSPFAIFLLLLFLCIFLYYVRAVANAHRHMVRLLREQLILEGKDKVFLLQLFDSAVQHRIFQENGAANGDKTEIRQAYGSISSLPRKRFSSEDSPSRRGSGTPERFSRPAHQQGFQYLNRSDSPGPSSLHRK